MKEHEAHQLLQELANDQTFPTKATLDDSRVRPDGSGYGVTIIWQVRKTTVKSREEWLSIKQAWQSQAQAPPIENGQSVPEYKTLRSEIE